MRDVFDGKDFVKRELYINGKGEYFTLGGVGDPIEPVVFNQKEVVSRLLIRGW